MSSFVLCAGLSGRAHAQTAPRHQTIVMFVDERVLPLARRMQQEIESLGMEVKVAPAATSGTGPSAHVALPPDAVAVIRLSPLGGDDVDMSIGDGAGRTVRYQLIASNPGDGASSELIATRAVELLRASLLERANAPAPPKAPAITKKAEEPPKPTRPLGRAGLLMSLGPAALYSPGFRMGASLQGALTWLPSPRFGVSASALVPIAEPRLEEAQGSVTVAARLFRLAGVVAFGGDSAPLTVRGALGVQLDDLRFQGLAVEPYRSADEQRVSWSGFVGAAPRLRLAPQLHLAAELALALSASRSRVRIAGDEVAEFGRPLASGALLLELSWPTGQ